MEQFNQNNKCLEIKLDMRVISYIKECLKDGNTLANYLYQQIDLHQGEAITILFEMIEEKDLYNFSIGGKILSTNKQSIIINGKNFIATPIKNTDSYLISLIEKFINADANNICIIENSIAEPDSYWLVQNKIPFMVYNNEVYHLIDKDNIKIANKIIKAAKSIPIFLGAMAVMPKKYNKLNNNVLTLYDLQIIARNTKKIFVQAYDGESYIIWSCY